MVHVRILKRHIPSNIFLGIREEARNADVSRRVYSSVCTLEPDGGINGRGSCRVSGPGPHLQSFHLGLGLTIAHEFAETDDEIFPTRSAYLHYDRGDYSFFHHDNVNAHITLILGLWGELLPLIMYPAFGPPDEKDVKILNDIMTLDRIPLLRAMVESFGLRSEFLELDLSEEYAIAIKGRAVPHARPRQPAAGILCTACYAFLVPSKEWQLPPK